MAQKQISRFPLNEKFSGLSGHVPNYESNDVKQFKNQRLQPEKSRNMFERIQKMKKKKNEQSFSTFRFLFAISSRVFAVE